MLLLVLLGELAVSVPRLLVRGVTLLSRLGSKFLSSRRFSGSSLVLFTVDRCVVDSRGRQFVEVVATVQFFVFDAHRASPYAVVLVWGVVASV